VIRTGVGEDLAGHDGVDRRDEQHYGQRVEHRYHLSTERGEGMRKGAREVKREVRVSEKRESRA
jgi:hypothetical protein